MKRLLLLLGVALALWGCYSPPPGDVERYMRNHEPKTGGPDL